MDYLDEEVREEGWLDEGEWAKLMKSWAVLTASGQEVAVYLAIGELRVLTIGQYKAGRQRVRDRGGAGPPGSVSLCRGAKKYLEGYRRRTGKLPTAHTWNQALEGYEDAAGECVWAWYYCNACQKWKKAPAPKSNDVDAVERGGITTCVGVLGRRCDEPGPQATAPPREVKTEANERAGEEEEEEDGSSVEITGFSPQARQFYKTASKHLRTPAYAGSSAEVDLVAWQRGAERYFETYGITRETEKVAIAADLLEGDALTWWNGMFLSGRHQEVRTWAQLKDMLKERFIPPEGEMVTVGKWRRAKQLGPVSSYSDYIHKLKALCDMGEAAEFRLAFYGLRPELQAEVRRQLRATGEKIMPLDKMFAVATDAEIGLGLRTYKGEGKEDKRKEGGEKRGYGQLHHVKGKEEEGKKKEREEDETALWCLVCDKQGHLWFACDLRKRGAGCARCGSMTHRIAKCPQVPQRLKTARVPQQVTMMRVRILQISGAPRTAQLLYFPVQLGRRWVEVMIDSGASVNCIDEQQLARVGGTLRPTCPGVLYYPDQRQATVKGTATLPIEAKGFRDRVTFWVVKGLGVSVLLGEPWLRYWNPVIDWQERALRFSDGVKWKAREGAKEEGAERSKRIRGRIATKETLRALRADSESTGEEEEELGWLEEFKDVFEEPIVAQLTTRTQHVIRLKEGARPYQKAPYRLAMDQREALEQEMREFLEKGWVRPSESEWATVPLIVPKKDGKPRVCIDYRDLNAIAEMDAYPLPKIDELLHRLAQANWFTKMDLRSGYHQIPMDPASAKYTAFRLSPPIKGCSLFEWAVMPMGLATAPATFQRWMDEALRGLEEKVVVYLDDVLVHSAEQQQHAEDVKEVLQRFREKGMKAKRSKCQFMRKEMAFLGHVVKEGQILIDPTKLQRLGEWEAPLQTVRQVRQLLGFLSYYRAFIPHFAEITAPLTEMLKKTKQFQWTAEATEAMGQAKRALGEACARYAWDPAREDRVTTDASGVGIAATFEQKVPGVGWAPTAFWSRKLSEAEKRYSTTDQEWLAVVEAVTRQWRHWLRGRKFTLRSDHGALKELLTKKGEHFSNRQYRWYERLCDFSFDFYHLAGNLNAAADALSRSPAYFVSALEVRHEQRRMADLGWEEVVKAAEKDWGYQEWRERQGEGGMQIKQGVAVDVMGRIVVPYDVALRTKIVLEAHEPPFCGHLGKKKTREQIDRTWRWDDVAKDIERIVGACDVCQRAAGKTRKQEAPLTPIVATAPWELVTMDFMSGMEPSVPGGWKGCAVVCDRFSRMMHVKECSTHPTAQEAAKLFIGMVIRAHGVPSKILTDRGTQFESLLWEEVMKTMGTRVVLATTHHPQTNGLTERMNRTLLLMIRKVCNQEKQKWAEMLPLLEFAYNNSVHSLTGVTPFEAIQGSNPVVPAALVVPLGREGSSPKNVCS